MIFKLAFRNIFRNKRRTLITMAAVAFAVFISSFMVSFQKGVWDSVMDNSINMFTGYIQVHDDGYWDEQTIDKSMLYDETLQAIPENIEYVNGVAPRLESMALASGDELTQGVMVIGIDPEKENNLTGIADKIESGVYLNNNSQGIILARGVADKLRLGVNDTLVLISQGYHGVNAAGKYPVTGIFAFALPELNKRLIYMPLASCQNLFGAEGRITSLVVQIDNKKNVKSIKSGLTEYLKEDVAYEVLDYEEMLPELVQAKTTDTAGSRILLGILYLLITFALFGTILMMTKERSYEFGVLTAIGMRRINLFGIVFTETIILGAIGTIAGIIAAIPLVRYMYLNPLNMAELGGEEVAATYEKFGMIPIFPAAFEAGIFINQAIIIFIVTCILAIYPLIKILKLQPIKAMRD